MVKLHSTLLDMYIIVVQEDIVDGLNIYGPRVQTRSTRHCNSRLANDLPVSGLREQIFEVGALLDEQGDLLRAMLQDVRYWPCLHLRLCVNAVCVTLSVLSLPSLSPPPLSPRFLYIPIST